jgi:hypothetical protein
LSLTAGTIYLDVKPDMTGFQTSVATGVNTAGKKVSSGLGSKLASFGKKMALPLVGGLAAIGGASINMASDFEESLSKVKVVFGKDAGFIEDWSKDAATAMGMSQQQALAAAGTYGNLFNAMGVGKKQTKDMSTSLVQLASDLASFNNASPEETLDALRSGLSGETEPLKRFGIAINAARLEEEALRLGLIKEGEELDAAAKAQATYSLVMKDTEKAQGDFARTSDGAANKQRILTAQLKDTGAKLGKMLLPLMVKALDLVMGLVNWFSKKAVPALKRFGATAADVFLAVWDVVRPVVNFIADAVVLAVKIIVGAVKGIVAVFKTAWGAIKAVWNGVGSFFGGIFDGIKSAAIAVWNGIANAWNSTIGSLSFRAPDWIPGIGGKGFDVPDIPTFHQGGVFRAPTPGGEGLAILRDGETIIPPGGGGPLDGMTVRIVDSNLGVVMTGVVEAERRYVESRGRTVR